MALHIEIVPRPIIEFHDEFGYVTINGVNYSYELFKEFGINGMTVGTPFSLEERTPYGDIVIRKWE